LKGIDARVNQVVGAVRRRSGVLQRLRREAEQVEALGSGWVETSDHDLHEKLMEYRGIFRRGGKEVDAALFPALAAIREAADRKLGLRPFLVQIMGTLALHHGWLAEMATGEGKTLTAGLAAVLAGWSREPCHIVTVNDYLVARDAEWMRPLCTFCGVRVGTVTASMPAPDRRKGYAADVTYVTSKELLADFLRDRLHLGALTNPARRLVRELLRSRGSAGDDGLVLRGLHTAIVDEADSVLIDEAVTPLIISQPRKNPVLESAVITAKQIATGLVRDSDFRVELRYREIELTGAGRDRLAGLCGNLEGIWRGAERREELVKQALVAREFFLRGKQYIIANDKVVIVDEFTGRQMAQRTWRQGLHQAIEAKEELPLSDPSETVARLSFQRFFRCFTKLSGMTGTAREAAGEFWQIYGLRVVPIPTNRPCRREHWSDAVFCTAEAKWRAVAEEVVRLHATGRPVLVGSRNVDSSENLAQVLAERQLPARILNAVRHEDEAVIVAQAGEPGCITIATNMAGRGTDIKLGPGVALAGGLHVLATERHEAGRVDRQLFGRAGRQGDPGSCQAFVSLEDDLIERHLPAALKPIVRSWGGATGEQQPWLTAVAFDLAQSRAQALAYQQRQAVLASDTWLDESLSFAGVGV
jgi:preprotein translocase subunit SecA